MSTRLLQFSLRRLFLVVTISAVALWAQIRWWTHQTPPHGETLVTARERAALDELKAAHRLVFYDSLANLKPVFT